MPRKLSDDVIATRMVELRNLRTLHAAARQREVAKDQRIHDLEATVAAQQRTIDTLLVQVAELQTMVFGRKKRPPAGGTPVPQEEPTAKDTASRDKASYRRPIPPATAITAVVAVPLPALCACGAVFDPSTITVHERYEEDIPLPELTPGYVPHLVTKYTVERGTCSRCGKATSSKDLGGAVVSLGPHVRLLVCHLVSVGGMSYRQIVDLFAVLYGLAISTGEIAAILQHQHTSWLPAYNQLKADIRGAPVIHADETPWPIQGLHGAGYAWVLADASSPHVCYALEQSRGAPSAQALFGQDTDAPFTGVRITDDYGPYRNPNLPGTQQLCWAHLYRSIRDLRDNDNLAKEQTPFVVRWYEAFAGIYQDLRQHLSQPYDEMVRATQSQELWQRVQALATEEAPVTGEPAKLTRLKAQLQRAGKDRLFTCLTSNTPCDNNRAERDLRQLVLKRKRSFGSQTEKGAKALATILSVCTTTWRTRRGSGYFVDLAGV